MSVDTDAAHNLDCFDQLQRTITSLVADDNNQVARIREYCSVSDFEVGGHLHEAGEVATRVYFICTGLVRFYYLTEEGEEHNKSFARESQFAGALQPSHRPEPSRFYIQALEPTTALAIPLAALNDLYERSLVWANVGRIYMETVAVRKARREGEFLLDSAEQRYRRFLDEEPRLAERLPLYHVASYLGITDVALSRIRRRLKQERLLNPG